MDVTGWQCIIYHLSRSACKIRDIDSDRLEAPVAPLLKLPQNHLSVCAQLWCALRLHINILTWILVFPASQNKSTTIKKKKKIILVNAFRNMYQQWCVRFVFIYLIWKKYICIQEGHVKLIKSKYIYIVTKYLYFKYILYCLFLSLKKRKKNFKIHKSVIVSLIILNAIINMKWYSWFPFL